MARKCRELYQPKSEEMETKCKYACRKMGIPRVKEERVGDQSQEVRSGLIIYLDCLVN